LLDGFGFGFGWPVLARLGRLLADARGLLRPGAPFLGRCRLELEKHAS